MKIEYKDGEWSVSHGGQEIEAVQSISMRRQSPESDPEIVMEVSSIAELDLEAHPELLSVIEEERFSCYYAAVCDGCCGIVADDIGMTEDGECTNCGELLVDNT